MPIVYLVPDAIEDIDSLVATSSLADLDNGPTTDDVVGLTTIGGDQTASVNDITLYMSDFPDVGKLNSATAYVRARIGNYTNDTLTWRVTFFVGGSQSVIDFTEADTTLTTKSTSVPVSVIGSRDNLFAFCKIENLAYSAVKGSDNSTFEIDEIWIEVNYESETDSRYWVGGLGTWINSSTLRWSNSSGGTGGWLTPTANTDVFFDANSDAGSNFTVTIGTGAVSRNLTASGLDKVMTINKSTAYTQNSIAIYRNLNLDNSNVSCNVDFYFYRQSTDNNAAFYINTNNNQNLSSNLVFSLLDSENYYERQKLTASDAANNDFFGRSVAIDSDTVIVGAYLEDGAGTDRGAAYVFTRSGSTWTQQQKLTASDAQDSDFFGYSVSISGDTAVAGAYGEDGAGTDRGAAYVFTRSGSTWTEQQKLTASDAADTDQFAWSVAISGDTAVVGAPSEDGAGTNRGAAYVFTRSGSTWTQQQKLTASDAQDSDDFGWSVAIDGDTAIVGAYLEDGAVNNSQRGAAYVFTRSGSTWTQQQKLTASDAQDSDVFGHSVAISGNTVIVGAYGEDGAGTDRGAAYVFTRSGTTWTQQQKLTASDTADSDQFGRSVAIDGDTCIVSADAEDGTGSDRGAAYAFGQNDDTGWQFSDNITLANVSSTITLLSGKLNANNYSANIGKFIANTGNNQTIIMGSGIWELRDSNQVWDVYNNGKTILYSNTSEIYLSNTNTKLVTVFTSGNLSYHKLVVGGVNNYTVTHIDGSNNHFYELTSNKTEAQELYFNSNTTNTFNVFTINGSSNNLVRISSFAPNRMAGVHNLQKSGTGIVDVDYLDIRNSNAAPSLTWYAGDNSQNTLSYSFQERLQGNTVSAGDSFGWASDISGNTVIVSARYINSNSGRVFVFTTDGSTWTQQADFEGGDTAQQDEFGTSIAIDDNTIVAGAPGEELGLNRNGSVYVFTRSGTTWTQQQKFIANDAVSFAELGFAVDISSNSNTIIAGAWLDPGGGTERGAAYIFTDSAGTWSQQQKLTASDGANFDSFGESVAIDKYTGNTVIVGASFHNNSRGAAYVFTRSGTTWTQQQKLTISGIPTNSWFGYSVHVLDDIAVVGAYGNDAAYVFTRSGGIWTLQQTLIPHDTNNNSFGTWVEISRDPTNQNNYLILVTADFEETSAPKAYLYAGSANNWIMREKLFYPILSKMTANNSAKLSRFGWDCCIDGNTAILTCPFEDIDGTDSGAVYAFKAGLYNNSGWIFTAPVSASAGNFLIFF